MFSKHDIVLCQGWFTNPTPSLNKLTSPSKKLLNPGLDDSTTRGVQLLHEMSHALFSTDDYILDNGERAYAHKNTLLLAQDDHNKARENADNYAFYALACRLARTNWSTNPFKIEYGGELEFDR
ncbi:MAG: hypothetical protein Q9226_007643 [Calogaya cf. arnoldii]